MRVKTNHLWILFALVLSLAMSGGILWLTNLAATAVFSETSNWLIWFFVMLPAACLIYILGLAACFATPFVGLSIVGEERLAELKGEDGAIPWKELLNDPASLILCGGGFSLTAWKWFGSDFVTGGIALGMAVVFYGLIRLYYQSRH